MDQKAADKMPEPNESKKAEPKHPKRSDELKHEDKTPVAGNEPGGNDIETVLDAYVAGMSDEEAAALTEDAVMQYLVDQGFEDDAIADYLSQYDDEATAEEAAEEEAQEEAARAAHEETGFDDLEGGKDWAGNTDVEVVDQTDGTQPDELAALIDAVNALPEESKTELFARLKESAPRFFDLDLAKGGTPGGDSYMDDPELAEVVEEAAGLNIPDRPELSKGNTSALAKLISNFRM